MLALTMPDLGCLFRSLHRQGKILVTSFGAHTDTAWSKSFVL